MGVARFAAFILIVLAASMAMHGYIWLRLVQSPDWPAPWSEVGAIAIFGMSLVVSLSIYFLRIERPGLGSPLAWVGFTWMGLAFIVFVLLLVTEPLRPLLSLLLQPPQEGTGAGRSVARLMAVSVVIVGVLLGMVAIISARLSVRARAVSIRLARWPAELSGYTIVQLSDVHVGETIGRGFVEMVVQRANSLNPDMIVITGDLVDGRVDTLARHVAPLASLRARDGTWFVTGNHEYDSGATAWVEHLSSLGMRVLRNERVSIRGELGFDLAGTDDLSARRFGDGHGQDIPRAMAGRDPRRAVILIAHQPRSFSEAAAHGVDLQLAGHTHGGQIYPLHHLTRLVHPFLAGLHRRGESLIYVSRGTGYWGPPMRLGAPPEITRIVISAEPPRTRG